MKTRIIFLGMFAFAALPSFGDDLWNQISGLPPAIASQPDQEFDDGIFDSFTSYLANDVEVGPGGWNVSSVTVEVLASNSAEIGNITNARLNVFQNTGSADTPASTDNPMNGQIVPVTVTPTSNRFLITATGLNLGLGAGEYWIDLTP